MVEMTKPTPQDVICDPAAGTCGFLVAAGEYLRERHPALFRDERQRKHFHTGMFHGFDFDPTMLRIGSMNMVLHGVENPDVSYRDSLAQNMTRCRTLFAHPRQSAFCGFARFRSDGKGPSANRQNEKDRAPLPRAVPTFAENRRTCGGGCAGRRAVRLLHCAQTLREMLVEKHKLEGVLKLPSGVFRPYAGVSTAILFFTKTGVGGTDHVWFYDLQADGLSLDDKRNDLLPPEKLGPTPREALAAGEHDKNNLPDALARWFARDGAEQKNPRTEQSFCVPKAEIAATGTYDLSLNRYKQVEHKQVTHESPAAIIADLRKLEDEISEGLTKLEVMLG